MRYEKPELIEVESALAVILAPVQIGPLDGPTEPNNHEPEGSVLAGLDE